MKLLIIDNSVLGQTLKTILGQQVSIILSSHEDALENFLLEEPDRVIICECWTDAEGKAANVSKITTEDILNSADATVVVKTMGFGGEAFGGNCDILLPLALENILESLEIKGET